MLHWRLNSGLLSLSRSDNRNRVHDGGDRPSGSVLLLFHSNIVIISDSSGRVREKRMRGSRVWILDRGLLDFLRWLLWMTDGGLAETSNRIVNEELVFLQVNAPTVALQMCYSRDE